MNYSLPEYNQMAALVAHPRLAPSDHWNWSCEDTFVSPRDAALRANCIAERSARKGVCAKLNSSDSARLECGNMKWMEYLGQLDQALVESAKKRHASALEQARASAKKKPFAAPIAKKIVAASMQTEKGSGGTLILLAAAAVALVYVAKRVST